MKMKQLYRILLTAVILVAAPLIGTAQNDSPLYQNVVSDNIDAQIDTTSSNVSRNNRQKPAADTAHHRAAADIDEQLRDLQRYYLAGKYNEALQTSQSLHEGRDLSPDQEYVRQMYTIAAFKDMEYNEKADSATKLFYGKNPFYDPDKDPRDPVSFRENVRNYYTMPRFSVWVAAGQSLAIPRLDTVHVITDTINTMKPDYDSELSESIQIGFEYHPLQWLSVSVAPTYTKYRYSRTTNRSMRATFHYDETDKIFSIPLHVEGYLITGKKMWVPSIYVGAAAKFIIKSTYNAYTQTVGEPQYRVDDTELDLDTKTKQNFALLFGGKISYNYRRLTIFGDLSLSYDLKPFNKPDAAFANTELAYDKMYIPDIFHVVQATALLGIKINLKYKTVAKYGYGH